MLLIWKVGNLLELEGDMTPTYESLIFQFLDFMQKSINL